MKTSLTPDTNNEPKVRILRPALGWRSIELERLWEYRELFWTLGLRDIQVRYKQTILGVLWVLLQPLLGAIVFSIVFGRVAHLSSDGIPYLLFCFSGILHWTLFSSTFQRANGALIHNSSLVTKVYFPRLILPLSVIPSALLDYIISLLFLVAMMAWWGLHPTLSWLWLPALGILLVGAGTGAGLWTGPLAVKYRDIYHLVPVSIQFLLFVTPVAYSISAVPPEMRGYFELNPLTGVMDAVRFSVFNVATINAKTLVYSGLASLALLVSGGFMFQRFEREFADVI